MSFAVPEPACTEPHHGCGCERDASQGAHTGPCEYEGGWGEGGAKVLCVKCLNVIRQEAKAMDAERVEVVGESGRGACRRCGGPVRSLEHDGECRPCALGIPPDDVATKARREAGWRQLHRDTALLLRRAGFPERAAVHDGLAEI